MALTAKQQRFCDEYLITLNGSDASRLAGYKTRADQQAYENLRKPEIKSYIEAKMREKNQELDISRENILRSLMEEAKDLENPGATRVQALSHLGRFTLGELNRQEHSGEVAFKWMDEDEEEAE